MLAHGVDAHSFALIHELPKDVSQDIINNYEQVYMDAYRSAGVSLLNIKEGGNGYGKHSEETKQIIKEKRALQVFGEEDRKRKSVFFSSIKRTPEWVAKVTAKSRGRKFSYETRMKSMKPVNQLSITGEFIKTWDCARNAGKELSISETSICNNVKGNSKSAGGFKWERL